MNSINTMQIKFFTVLKGFPSEKFTCDHKPYGYFKLKDQKTLFFRYFGFLKRRRGFNFECFWGSNNSASGGQF